MESPSQFKHPSLEEYLSRGKEWYDAWTKVYGTQSMQPWAALAKELTQEHAMVSKMDPVKRRVYWFEKGKRSTLILSAEQERLRRMDVAAKTRQLAGDSLRDVKEQQDYARRTRKG